MEREDTVEVVFEDDARCLASLANPRAIPHEEGGACAS